VSVRLRLLVLLFVVGWAVILAAIVVQQPSFGEDVAAPNAPILPDLVTSPLSDFLIGTDELTGDEALRFTATIANVGDGTLRLEARRSNGSDPRWAVVQWFDEPDDSRSGARIDANLVFGGHGHEHWHVRFGAAYRLSRAGTTDDLVDQTKAGYCFFDQVRLDPAPDGAPSDSTFATGSCGDQGSISIMMGLSPGWSDPYQWYLEDQSVDISGMPDGRYRLLAVADPDGWIQESDETNNETWVDLEFGTNPDGLRTVTVVGISTP